MQTVFPPILERLVGHFSRLPGIGRKTAQRLAMAALEWRDEDLLAFGEDLRNLRQSVKHCPCCGSYTEGQLCAICASQQRNHHQVCVVEQASQIAVFENAGCFNGVYHVLGGRIAPLSGIGPEKLRISELIQRVESGEIEELILATSPDVAGEATANFIASLLADYPVEITRLAAGLPAGADVGYADAATLALALSGRHKL